MQGFLYMAFLHTFRKVLRHQMLKIHNKYNSTILLSLWLSDGEDNAIKIVNINTAVTIANAGMVKLLVVKLL